MKQTIQTLDGLHLHLVIDQPQTKPKAILVIAHGMSDHSGTYADFAKTMNNNHVAVYRFDQRGHGQSDGRDSIHISSYFEMVEDLRLVIEKAKADNPNTPVFVMGHSMGGHISALYGTKYPQDVDGFIFAAAVLRYNQMLYGYLPRPEPADSFFNAFELIQKNLNLPVAEHATDYSDPLLLNQVSVSFANAFKESIPYLKHHAHQFVAPVLLLGGNEDLLVLPKDAIDFYQETSSTDKNLRLYSSLGHMLMFENGGDIVVNDIVDWINRRTKSLK